MSQFDWIEEAIDAYIAEQRKKKPLLYFLLECGFTYDEARDWIQNNPQIDPTKVYNEETRRRGDRTNASMGH